MKDIKRFMEHLECPIVDGIMFPDKSIQLLDVKVPLGRSDHFKITRLSSTSIENLEAEEKLWIAGCAVLYEFIDIVTGIKVLCGEASWGSDGFIAVLEIETEDLIWMAYFTESNPFHRVTVVDRQIIAVSTLDCVWSFDISNPVNIEVTCL